MRRLIRSLPTRRGVSQLHWGGGTPTHLEPDQIEALYRKITDHFQLDPSGEIAIEADPRVTTREQIDLAIRYGAGQWRDVEAHLLMPELYFPVVSAGFLRRNRGRNPVDLLKTNRIIANALHLDGSDGWWGLFGVLPLMSAMAGWCPPATCRWCRAWTAAWSPSSRSAAAPRAIRIEALRSMVVLPRWGAASSSERERGSGAPGASSVPGGEIHPPRRVMWERARRSYALPCRLRL